MSPKQRLNFSNMKGQGLCPLPSDYEGLTTIDFLISPRASELDMETMSLIAHRPQYTRFEKGYMGRLSPKASVVSLKRLNN